MFMHKLFPKNRSSVIFSAEGLLPKEDVQHHNQAAASDMGISFNKWRRLAHHHCGSQTRVPELMFLNIPTLEV